MTSSLASAWAEVTERGIDDRDEFVEAWHQQRTQRLEEAGLDPVWR